MNRRRFIQHLCAGTAGAFAVQALPFESLASAAFLRTAGTATDTDHVLVLIQLNGGNDGLNTVLPLDQYTKLSAARANILIPEQKALRLNGFDATGLHPAMSKLQQRFNDGQMAIIQSVGYPEQNYSHFRSTDIWMSGSDARQVLTSGWSGRYLDYEYPGFPVDYPSAAMPDPLSIAIGGSSPLVFQGPETYMGVSIADPTNVFSMATGTQEPPPDTHAGKELLYLREVARQSDKYSNTVFGAYNAAPPQFDGYPTGNKLADQLKVVARLIAGGLKTRLYLTQIGGFDTHSVQVDAADVTQGTHAGLLTTLSEAVDAFMSDLKLLGLQDRVVAMTFSEFGRRIISNASLGTDHGSTLPVLVFGAQVQPGIVGTNPEIPADAKASDNLPMQHDFRSVYATMLQDWLCVPTDELNQTLLKDFATLPVVKSAACEATARDRAARLTDASLKAYPNPFHDDLTLEFPAEGGGARLEVLDVQGRIVHVQTVRDGYATLYGGDWAPGVYYLRLEQAGGVRTRTVIKR